MKASRAVFARPTLSFRGEVGPRGGAYILRVSLLSRSRENSEFVIEVLGRAIVVFGNGLSGHELFDL